MMIGVTTSHVCLIAARVWFQVIALSGAKVYGHSACRSRIGHRSIPQTGPKLSLPVAQMRTAADLICAFARLLRNCGDRPCTPKWPATQRVHSSHPLSYAYGTDFADFANRSHL